MAKIHDLFIVELAEVIKGYGNEPDDEDPFRLAEFYRFYELPNIAVSRENFEKMRPAEPERKTGKWIPLGVRHGWICSKCRKENVYAFSMDDNLEYVLQDYFCPNCGADMRGEQE